MVGLLSGCVWLKEDPGKLPLGVDPQASPLAGSAAYRDTIGAYTYYEGLRPMRVRGYGLVVGLGNNGSRDCPRPICDPLVKSLYKEHRFASSVVGEESITPERMINDMDTAIVVVQGDIPPAAVRGSRFDVAVSTAPGTETKSLRGGRLYTADLHVFQPVSTEVAITGQVLAQAAGPVFLNPFSADGAATRVNPREGVIIGGGIVTQSRRVRLVLTQPSYQRARQIQNRINSHFSGAGDIANAISPSFVHLRVPPEYADDTGHFLGLVRSLYLSSDPQFEATRVRALVEEIQRPDAPHALIALALEGIGQASLPPLDDLYRHREDYAGFHAAVAGMRLGDHVAADAIAVHAKDPNCDYRFQAVRALGEAHGMAGAGMALRQLLHESDARVQIAAYEALLKRDDVTVASRPVGGDNFRLDQVPSGGDRLIYVKRAEERRIALFGDGLRVRPPVFYRAPDGGLTLNASADDSTVTVLRVVVSTGAMSEPFAAPLELPALISLLGEEARVRADGTVLGFGVDYGTVVHALYELCETGAIKARFVLEQPNVTELFGPGPLTGRPESEL